jgi:hypothetical protein
MSDKPIFFKPTIRQIVGGLDAIQQQFNLLLALAMEIGVDDEMEELMLEIPHCRAEVLRHYLELNEDVYPGSPTTLVDRKE